MFYGTRLHVAVETVGELARFEPLAVADNLRVPALFLHGANDLVVPPDVAASCATRAAADTFATVEDAGHLVVLDQRDTVARLLHDFVIQ
jgi:pimeloyl-ACP methyl ester carboxylesterase